MTQVVRFVINGMIMCFNTMKEMIFDKIGTVNITLYSFFIFVIFMTIVIRLINFIKGIQEVENDNKKKYSEEKRYKK